MPGSVSWAHPLPQPHTRCVASLSPISAQNTGETTSVPASLADQTCSTGSCPCGRHAPAPLAPPPPHSPSLVLLWHIAPVFHLTQVHVLPLGGRQACLLLPVLHLHHAAPLSLAAIASSASGPSSLYQTGPKLIHAHQQHLRAERIAARCSRGKLDARHADRRNKQAQTEMQTCTRLSPAC